MLPNETISEMFTRFTKINTALFSLGKLFTESENVRKILRSLPKSWLHKVTSMTDAKDLKRISVDELVGSLIAHEQVVAQLEIDENKTKKEKPIDPYCT